MVSIFTALAPVFIVILLGAVFKKKSMPGDDFWPLAERITYYVLLPSLFFRSVANASFEGWDVGLIFQILILLVLGSSLFLLAFRRISRMDGPGFTSVFQGAIRFNNYVGIPSAYALYGQDGLVLSALLIALLVPMINSACIAVLHYYGSGEKVKPLKSLYRIITKPLILACIWGGFVNASGLGLPIVLDKVLEVLSQASLAFGLLCVGAGLDIKATKGTRHWIAVACFCKLLLLPLAALGLCLWLGLEGTAAQVMVLYMALPAASSSYIMAKQLGGNAHMMAGILVVQTVVAALTMPLVILVGRMVF
jgi:malonate transporter